MKKKSYCTQNDGDCFSCSLVNYNLDCMNNLVEYSAADEEREIADDRDYEDMVNGLDYDDLKADER